MNHADPAKSSHGNNRELKDYFFIHVAGTLNNPIIKSQVLNWIALLEEKGIASSILCCIPLPALYKGRKAEMQTIRSFRRLYHGAITRLPVLRSSDRFNLVSQWIKVIYLFFYVRKIMKTGKYKQIVLQTRSRFNYYPFKVLKKIFKNVKTVFDLRGAVAIEYLNEVGYDSVEMVKDEKILKRYHEYLDSETNMVLLSDLTFCVSYNMRDYLISGKKALLNKNIRVVPGAADEGLFFYDPGVGKRKRAELNREEGFLMIYSGGLKNFYQKRDLVFEFASVVLQSDPKAFFICLTIDTGIAAELMTRYGIDPGRIHLSYVKNPAEINAYLNAADLGIIFRDPIRTNHVSSPTKAAEYLLSGIPMLISEGTGDYSEFIRENNLGIVVRNDMNDMIRSFHEQYPKIKSREEISRISKMRYSKQANLDNILDSIKICL